MRYFTIYEVNCKGSFFVRYFTIWLFLFQQFQPVHS